MITFTKPILKDLPQILDLWQGQYDYHHDIDSVYYVPFDKTTKPKFEKYLVNGITKEDPHFLIAEDDNKIIGFITFNQGKSDYLDTNIEKYGEIIELFVDPSYRKQGIGSQLISTVEKIFKNEGIDMVKLQVSTFNQNAIKFYDQLGYINRQTFMFKKIN